jgi:hypothetical protein
MKKTTFVIDGTDLVAIILILGALFLNFLGKGDFVDPVFSLIAGYYFGKKASIHPKNLKKP